MMFAVIYRGYVKPEKEQAYQTLWHLIASYFVEHRGAIGSSLHKTEEGMWLAYSRWPDRATRDASWPQDSELSHELPSHIIEAIHDIKSCLDESRKYPEIAMDIVDDLLHVKC